MVFRSKSRDKRVDTLPKGDEPFRLETAPGQDTSPDGLMARIRKIREMVNHLSKRIRRLEETQEKDGAIIDQLIESNNLLVEAVMALQAQVEDAKASLPTSFVPTRTVSPTEYIHVNPNTVKKT